LWRRVVSPRVGGWLVHKTSLASFEWVRPPCIYCWHGGLLGACAMEEQNTAKLQKSFFVFLLVRPYCSSNACDVCVDTVLGGKGLSAKIEAKNESLRKSSRILLHSAPQIKRWRVLLGFYVHKSTWTRKIKTQWRKDCRWEKALLQGVKFALQFSVNGVLYISSEARSEPPSPLLCGLQKLSQNKDPSERCRMMSVIMSDKTMSEKLLELVTPL